MGMLSNIFNKIFHHDAPGATAPADAPATAPAAATAAPATAAAPAPVAMQEVDVEALLNSKAQQHAEKLNWRTSIVDLLKLLELDSSMAARKELAQELHFSGDSNDSASMNMWLHRQVMNKLAANGGKVPAELKD